jgi:hypothetical protein
MAEGKTRLENDFLDVNSHSKRLNARFRATLVTTDKYSSKNRGKAKLTSRILKADEEGGEALQVANRVGACTPNSPKKAKPVKSQTLLNSLIELCDA